MAKPKRDTPAPFVLPSVYTAPDTPGYQPAWQRGSILDFDLVLEGGAMRGQFTAGVCDLLMDEGLLPARITGVSAGALNGFNLKAGQRGRSCYLNLKYCTDWRYFSMRSFALTGSAFNARYVYKTIPRKLEPFDFAAYNNSPIQLTTVASDLVCGEANYHQLVDANSELDWLRASAAMPLVSRIVHLDGLSLLDGGICDSVPLAYVRSAGSQAGGPGGSQGGSWGSDQGSSRRQVVVLTQDADYVKKPNRAMPAARRLYARYPLFVERMQYRHVDYNRCYRWLAKLAADGEICLLRPPVPVKIKSMEHDPHKLYALYQLGYDTARSALPALIAYLE